jgi:hypothetical protein
MNADELSFHDNPYVNGGVRFGWDTMMGTPKKPRPKQQGGSNNNTNLSSQFGVYGSIAQSSTAGGSQKSSNTGNGGRNSGNRGGNFRENRGGYNKNKPQNSQKRSFDDRNE